MHSLSNKLINTKRSIIFLRTMSRRPCKHASGCFKFQKGQDCGFSHDGAAAMGGMSIMGSMGGGTVGMGNSQPSNPNPGGLGQKPCFNGANCNNWKKGTCKFGHDSMQMPSQPTNNTNACKWGINCNKWKQGQCTFNHGDSKQSIGNIPV